MRRRRILLPVRMWLLLTAALLLVPMVLHLWGEWRDHSSPPAARLAAAPPLRTLPLRALQMACERHPDDAAALVALGGRLDQLGAERLAYGAFARAAAVAPRDGAAHEGWARLAGRLQSPRQAVAILAPFVRACPSDAIGHLALAGWYQKTAARRLAYNEAAAAARLDPADPAAPREMATAAIALGEYSQAESALRRVLALSPVDWRSALDLGFVLNNRNRRGEALACYRQASQIASSEAEPLRLYGQALLQEADTPQSLAEAGQCLARAAELNPKDVLTHVLLAQAATRLGDWRRARAQISIAQSLPPAASAVQSLQAFLAARIYQRSGQPEPMRRAQQRHANLLAYLARKTLLFDSIVAHPTDVNARLALARDCAVHGDIEEAIAAYRRLLTYAPHGPVAQKAEQELEALAQRRPAAAPPSPDTSLALPVLVEDASTLAKEGQSEAAGHAYMKALALDPNSAEALLGIGLCLKHQGKSDLEFAFLDRAFQLGAHDAPLELDIAAQFEANGFHDAARVRLERLVAYDPGDAPSWHLLGSVCAQGTQYSRESLESYTRAARLAPQNVGYLLDAADADADAGQPVAEAQYRRAVALAPGNADALSRLAGFLVAGQIGGGRAAEAAELLTQALHAQPDNEFAWYQRGLLALSQGRAQEAVGDLRRSVALAPSVAQAWYALARACRRAGDAGGAARASACSERLQRDYFERAHLEERVHLAPSDPALRLQLARTYAGSGAAARAVAEYEACLRQAPEPAVRREFAAFQTRLRAAGRLPSPLVFRYMLSQQDVQ